jgi:hypothetical protein
VRGRFDCCSRVDGGRDAAAPESRDGHDDHCQRAEAGRGACGVPGCLVAWLLVAAHVAYTVAWLLVAAHVAYTAAWLLVLLGLAGLYAAQRRQMGPLRLVGFLTAFAGTYLIAVTGNFGFLAPVLAKQSPAVLDSINQYVPVVLINGLAAILFMIGYVLFGVAMIRTSTVLRWSGVLVAVGAPAHLLGFGIAQLVSTAAWPIAILGSVSLGAGLAWPGYRLWRAPTASDVVVSDKSTRA